MTEMLGTLESAAKDGVYSVLLVEDNELDVEVVRRSFRRDSLSHVMQAIELTVANSLTEAFRFLSQNRYNAILLDLGLPEGAGIEILHRVAALNLAIPVIILTGNEDDGLGVAALRAGADDFLKKSAISPETLPRSVRYSIERNQRILAETQLHRTQAEILAAETIQQRLLPSFSPQVANFDIAGACLPAEKIGGDLFDYLEYDASSCVGVVADVSGHGLPAAILMTELHGLLHGLIEQNVSLPRLMSAANLRAEKATDSHQFITMISYHLSSARRSFSFISAGHPAWLLKADGSHSILKSLYLPLGILDRKGQMELTHLRLEQGDIVVLPTDGVFEALGEQRQRFGSQRMLKLVAENKLATAAQIVQRVLADVHEFSIGEQLLDDCTLVIIKSL